MRILTWNLNGRTPSDPSWEAIDEWGVDVAFVQEAPPSEGTEFPPERWIWEPIGDNSRYGSAGSYRWATGIRARSGMLTPIDTGSLGPGWIAGATYDADGRRLTLVNAHIEIVETATATLLRTISELEDILRGDDVVFGGDLNVDRQYGERHGTRRHAEALDRIKELGLFHVNDLLPEGTRTFISHPYQDDHFFVSESLRDSIVDVSVLVGSRSAALSDHYPLLLQLGD